MGNFLNSFLLTLSQPVGQIMPTTVVRAPLPWIFRPWLLAFMFDFPLPMQ